LIRFPVPVSELLHGLPLRPPAVWIDSVTWVTKDEGECIVLPTQTRALPNRPAEFLECLAQASGFVSVCHVLLGYSPQRSQAARAYLVGVSDMTFDRPEGNEYLRIVVRRTHDLPPLSLVEGIVFCSAGKQVAQGTLKLYADS
jgi:hypothetical protein